jgi:thiamine biosynthesis lipoprotein
MWKYLPAIILFLSACNIAHDNKPVKLLGEAQGTYYSIIYFDSQQRDFQYEIDSILKAFDQSVSLWVPESILSKVNNNNNKVLLNNYFIDNFQISKKVAEETNGAFDFTIGPLVKAWGFGYNNHMKVDSVIIDSLLQLVGYEKVDIVNNKVVKQNPNTTFDFNAIAQGYSVDVIGKFLESKLIDSYLVDIGGEVKAVGQKPDGNSWKVGIEKPSEESNSSRDLTAIIKLENQSVATSGNYRKFFEKDGIRYSHTINPFTGHPTGHNLLSVSIVTNNTALADAYATACMVMGLNKSIEFIENRNELEAFFIFSNEKGDYDIYATDGFSKLIISEPN